MSYLVTFDPGLRCAGLSVFRDATLHYAALVRNPEKKARGLAAWLPLASETYLATTTATSSRPFSFVSEFPQVYRGPRANDPADLLELAGVVGAVGRALSPADVRVVLPREWGGQVPKDIKNARVLAKLTPAEHARIEPCPASLLHNVLDAIGIGLWVLGR